LRIGRSFSIGVAVGCLVRVVVVIGGGVTGCKDGALMCAVVRLGFARDPQYRAPMASATNHAHPPSRTDPKTRTAKNKTSDPATCAQNESAMRKRREVSLGTGSSLTACRLASYRESPDSPISSRVRATCCLAWWSSMAKTVHPGSQVNHRGRPLFNTSRSYPAICAAWTELYTLHMRAVGLVVLVGLFDILLGG
jgi:hypothetical protein